MLNHVRRLAGLALGVAALLPAAPSRADIMIAPTRVVLGGADHSAELVVMNEGKETSAFRVSLENRRMRRDGSFEEATDAKPGELFANDLVRFAPRRVVLEPGSRQTIVVSALPNAGLAPGEYRSHLRLMAAPTSAGQTLADAGKPADNTMSIQLVAIRSLTIPVILRVGELSASVKIDGATLGGAGRPEDLLAVTMSRTGTRSTYGDVRLTIDGERQPAYTARGVAIYVPNAERDVLLPLPAAVKAKLAGHTVRIDYVSADARFPGMIASTSIRL